MAQVDRDEVVTGFAVQQVVIVLESAIVARDRCPCAFHVLQVQTLELELVQTLVFDTRNR